MGGRTYISDFLLNYYLPFVGATLLLPLYFLESVLRPDLFFALIVGRWIAQQFCNRELLNDLRVTLLSSGEIIRGILGNYIVLLCGFQLSAVYFIYQNILNNEELVVRLSNGTLLDFSYVVLLFATLEDCTYAVAVLLIFVWELIKRNLSVAGVLVAFLKVALLTIPLMIVTLLFESVLMIFLPIGTIIAWEPIYYNFFWFSISIPFELLIIGLNLWRIHHFLGKKWKEED